jgi:hypothetical protein
VPTLKESIDELTKLKHRLAVWEAMSSFLDDNFLSKDGRKAPRALKVPDCLVELVSEDTVESVLQAIGEGPISDLQKEIATIESQEVVVISRREGDGEKAAS